MTFGGELGEILIVASSANEADQANLFSNLECVIEVKITSELSSHDGQAGMEFLCATCISDSIKYLMMTDQHTFTFIFVALNAHRKAKLYRWSTEDLEQAISFIIRSSKKETFPKGFPTPIYWCPTDEQKTESLSSSDLRKSERLADRSR